MRSLGPYRSNCHIQMSGTRTGRQSRPTRTRRKSEESNLLVSCDDQPCVAHAVHGLAILQLGGGNAGDICASKFYFCAKTPCVDGIFDVEASCHRGVCVDWHDLSFRRPRLCQPTRRDFRLPPASIHGAVVLCDLSCSICTLLNTGGQQ